MRKLLFFGITVLLILLAKVAFVQGSPSVLIEPDRIYPDGYVDIYVTATKINTNISVQNDIPGIIVFYELDFTEGFWEESWVLLRENEFVNITLPDIGDKVRIRFPDAEIEVVCDEDGDVAISPESGTLLWINECGEHAPDMLELGDYAVWLSGYEREELYFFTVSSFLVIPEAVIGVITVLSACFASLGIKRLRRK